MLNYLRPYTPAICWCIFIFIICTLPGEDIPEIPSWWNLIKPDKLVHMTIFCLLSSLILRGWHKTQKQSSLNDSLVFGCFVALSCALFGLFVEWYQENYCIDRKFEYFDALANAIGAFGGLSIFMLFQHFNTRHRMNFPSR